MIQILSTKTCVTRKRTYGANSVEDTLEILRELVSVRHTGPITINMGQGAIRGMNVEDYSDVENTRA